jgi:hypothetical protein
MPHAPSRLPPPLRALGLGLLLLVAGCAAQPGAQTGAPVGVPVGAPGGAVPGQITVSLSGATGVAPQRPQAGTPPGQITVSLSGLTGAVPAAIAPGHAFGHAADIAGPVCVAQHRALIEEALGVARARTEEAARLVASQPNHPHITRWFGTAPRAEIASRLQRTAARLAQPDTFKVLCNDPPACTGSRMAYASAQRGVVGLCPGFFRASMDGYDTRWGILVHEASHLAAETNDHAYGPTAALALAKDDPRRAAENADNLEYFVETLPR